VCTGPRAPVEIDGERSSSTFSQDSSQCRSPSRSRACTPNSGRNSIAEAMFPALTTCGLRLPLSLTDTASQPATSATSIEYRACGFLHRRTRRCDATGSISRGDHRAAPLRNRPVYGRRCARARIPNGCGGSRGWAPRSCAASSAIPNRSSEGVNPRTPSLPARRRSALVKLVVPEQTGLCGRSSRAVSAMSRARSCGRTRFERAPGSVRPLGAWPSVLSRADAGCGDGRSASGCDFRHPDLVCACPSRAFRYRGRRRRCRPRRVVEGPRGRSRTRTRPRADVQPSPRNSQLTASTSTSCSSGSSSEETARRSSSRVLRDAAPGGRLPGLCHGHRS
jgi:hypothetical protein